jgi:hypothetical protein
MPMIHLTRHGHAARESHHFGHDAGGQMLVAVLDNGLGSIHRDVDFSRGVFSAEGLGEVSVEDLREFDAAGQLSWCTEDLRMLTLGYSADSAISLVADVCLADAQLQLAVETEVVYVPPHRPGTKTEAELHVIVEDMTSRGWMLVEDTRIGASGGHLTFQRSEPLDSRVLQSLPLER